MAAYPAILVTGAGGALGHLVVEALGSNGSRVVAGSRSPDAAGLAAYNTRRIDFDDLATLTDGFAGIDRALIISTDTLDDTGRRQRQHQAAFDAAKDQGVSYLAYTSMPNPEGSAAISFAPDHVSAEQGLARSGIAYGVLRNAWYQENLLTYLPQVIADGTWYTIAAERRIAHVARQDAADAAAALLGRGQVGIFDISGPELLSIDELAAAVTDVLDRPIVVEQVDQGRLAHELARQGVPDPVIPMVIATEANQRDGAFEVLGDDVERLTGRPATGFTDFLRARAGLLLSYGR